MHEIPGNPDDHRRTGASGEQRPASEARGAPRRRQVRRDLDTSRWQGFLDGIASLTGDLSLDEVLRRLLQVTADLTGAERGSLTLLHPTDVAPMRVAYARPAAEATRARSWLGPGEAAHRALRVPIHLHRRIVGMLHLSAQSSAPGFTEQDQQVVLALVGVAEVGIENARLHQSERHEPRPGAALTRQPTPDGAALEVVADWARAVGGADAAWITAGPDPAHLRLRAVAGGPGDPERMAEVDFTSSLSRCVAVSGRPLNVMDISQHARALDVSGILGGAPMGPALAVPLSGYAEPLVLTLAWRTPVEAARLRRDAPLATALIEQAPLVLQAALMHSDEPRRAVMADRDRIARDLHDLVVQQLFAIGLELRDISWLKDPDEMAERLGRSTHEIDEAIREIRTTIFRLGSMGESDDLRAALDEVVDRAARTMKVRPVLRLEGPVSLVGGTELMPDVLAVVSEMLSNVARHARASSCLVEVSLGREVRVRVSDDGDGIAPDAQEGGLVGLRERAERHRGELRIESEPGHGTTVTWRVPFL